MNIGMLWFDNDPKAELNTKVERAAVYYLTKYGRAPNLCFVHPSMLPSAPQDTAEKAPQQLQNSGVEVRPHQAVLPNHLWIGVNTISAGAD